MYRLFFTGLTFSAVSVLAGCESFKQPLAIDWEHGARRGTIGQAYDAHTPVAQLPPCLANQSQSVIAAHRYVEVIHQHRRHQFSEVGELPAGLQVHVGDRVEFYPKSCDAGLLSTISRLLPTVPQS